MAKHEIRAMLPGVFYRKSAPDQPNYKNPGDSIAKGDVIGLIEVMKSFHEIKSDADGTVGEFKIDSEEPVMPGQVLVEIEI